MNISLCDSRRIKRGLVGLIGAGMALTVSQAPLGAATPDSGTLARIESALETAKNLPTSAPASSGVAGVSSADGAEATTAANPGFVSKWASAEWNGVTGSQTVHSVISVGLDQEKNQPLLKTLEVDFDTRFCQRMSFGRYNLVERSLDGIFQNPAGATLSVTPTSSAKASAKVVLSGTETRTPSTARDCSTATGAAVTVPLSTKATVKVDWKKRGSQVQYENPDEGAKFLYQDAKADGSIEFPQLSVQNKASGSTNTAWIWQGIWTI